jgi:hypothetical protein
LASGLGVTDSAWPFQVSMRGVADPLSDDPTRTQKDAPAHDTERRLLPAEPGSAATVTPDQEFPVHCSANGLGGVIAPWLPTARQKDVLTHDTLFSWLNPTERLGPGTNCQVEPFHTSLIVVRAGVPVPLEPTAMHQVLLRHETLKSWAVIVPPGNDAAVPTDQLDPFHVSMSVPEPIAPTATQKEGPAHETPSRIPPWLAVAPGTRVHEEPSHCSMSVLAPIPCCPTATQKTEVAQATPLTERLTGCGAVGALTAVQLEAVTVGGTAAAESPARIADPDTISTQQPTKPRKNRRTLFAFLWHQPRCSQRRYTHLQPVCSAQAQLVLGQSAHGVRRRCLVAPPTPLP